MKSNQRNRMLPGIGAALGMLALILDTKTAIAGATEGVMLCLRTVVPSLFPFFVLSMVLTGSLSGRSVPILRPLGRLCGIPRGAESLLLVGALGGYPVGAQCVADAAKSGSVSQKDAGRMLGFCSNAGPAFLFGMGTALFDSVAVPAALWAIHLISALLVGALLPGKNRDRAVIPAGKGPGFSEAVTKSAAAMAGVCGWVVLFRVLLSLLDRWFLWLLPGTARVLIYGVLEMTNGFVALKSLPTAGLRFVLCSVFLAFGGLCVTMQTSSVTGRCGLKLGMYVPGKLLQACLSLNLSAIVQIFLFPAEKCPIPWALPALSLCTVAGTLAFLGHRKKRSSIPAAVGV